MNAERYERIVALARAGDDTPRIAAALGISTRTVQRARLQAGLALPSCGRNPMTDAELALAAALLEDGASYREVGRTLKRTGKAIANHLPNMGWPSGSGPEYRQMMRALDSIRGAA